MTIRKASVYFQNNFSVARLQKLLSCYDSTISIALGERYGYNIYDKRGYNYITGGGGIVFSRILLENLAVPGTCDCPSISSPDDMYLGICIARLGIEITHVPYFHQVCLLVCGIDQKYIFLVLYFLFRL